MRLSSCGAYYLACTPEAVKRPLEAEGRLAKGACVVAEAAGEPEVVPAEEELDVDELPEEAEVEALLDDEVSGGEEEEAAAAEGGTALAPGEAPGDGGEAPGEGEEAPPEQVTIRERTLTVPVSVSNSAPTPTRLHALLSLSDVEEGAPVSLALVAGDGTVIVSHLYRGFRAPDVLDSVADEDE